LNFGRNRKYVARNAIINKIIAKREKVRNRKKQRALL